MALPAASVVGPSTLTVTSSRSRLHHLHSSSLINVHRQHASFTCSAKFPWMEHFDEPTKVIVVLNSTKEKLWKIVPGSVKQFPWKKAERVAVQELLILGKETLKWCLLAYFGFSCLSDIIYSISRNRELAIPFGLFVGVLMTKFFNEITHELVHDHKDGCTKRLVGISCFFVLVKLLSTGANDFMLHAANGGLMEVLWNWKDGEKSYPDDVPTYVSGAN